MLFAGEGTTSPYSDTVGDIDPGLSNGGGTLDIVGMEVTNTLTDVIFKLTVNGDVSTTDWGNFLVGIATGGNGTVTGNGWDRPINLSSPVGGMDYWIGAWVNSGGGAQLWSYDGSAWTGPGALVDFGLTSGATSDLTYTASLASLGLSTGDTFYFDAYSSGGGGTDSAVDSLANPNISITSWSQVYTSSTTESAGLGLNSYTLVPEPSTYLLSGLGLVALFLFVRRRKA